MHKLCVLVKRVLSNSPLLPACIPKHRNPNTSILVFLNGVVGHVIVSVIDAKKIEFVHNPRDCGIGSDPESNGLFPNSNYHLF